MAERQVVESLMLCFLVGNFAGRSTAMGLKPQYWKEAPPSHSPAPATAAQNQAILAAPPKRGPPGLGATRLAIRSCQLDPAL